MAREHQSFNVLVEHCIKIRTGCKFQQLINLRHSYRSIVGRVYFLDYLNFTLLGCSSSSSIRTSGSGLGLVDRHARTLVRARPARCRFPSSYERKNSQRETRFLILVYQEHGGRFRLSLHSFSKIFLA